MLSSLKLLKTQICATLERSKAMQLWRTRKHFEVLWSKFRMCNLEFSNINDPRPWGIVYRKLLFKVALIIERTSTIFTQFAATAYCKRNWFPRTCMISNVPIPSTQRKDHIMIYQILKVEKLKRLKTTNSMDFFSQIGVKYGWWPWQIFFSVKFSTCGESHGRQSTKIPIMDYVPESEIRRFFFGMQRMFNKL